jgi:hypothetical protein
MFVRRSLREESQCISDALTRFIALEPMSLSGYANAGQAKTCGGNAGDDSMIFVRR